MMRITIETVTDGIIHQLSVQNLGPIEPSGYDDPGGERQYRWASSTSRRGIVMHERRNGALALVAAVCEAYRAVSGDGEQTGHARDLQQPQDCL